MPAYDHYFKKHHIITGQGLITHADIEDHEDRANSLRKVLDIHFQMGTLPILNENDTVSSEELLALERGIDNDKNALLIAELIGARILYIITNTNGVYEKKDNPGSCIPEISYTELTDAFIEEITGEKLGKPGKKGMCTKLEVARAAAKIGIETHIINGTDSKLLDHYRGNHYEGTIILPI